MDSKLQIISGLYRGRKLNLPPDARPTQNRARIALFNMMASGIIDDDISLTIWDAFAGSGAFGLECLSRYPDANVIFTDISETSIKTVRKNLETLNVGARASAVKTDALCAITKYGPVADLLFLDPPYDMHEYGVKFVAHFGRVAKPGAILIWEQDDKNKIEPDTNTWEIVRNKKYGRATFWILRKKPLV